jgi:hypothetical protein
MIPRDIVEFRIHIDAALRHASFQVLQHSEKVVAQVSEHYDGRVNSDLKGLRVLPHHGKLRVEVKHSGRHAQIVPINAPRRGALYTDLGVVAFFVE